LGLDEQKVFLTQPRDPFIYSIPRKNIDGNEASAPIAPQPGIVRNYTLCALFMLKFLRVHHLWLGFELVMRNNDLFDKSSPWTTDRYWQYRLFANDSTNQSLPIVVRLLGTMDWSVLEMLFPVLAQVVQDACTTIPLAKTLDAMRSTLVDLAVNLQDGDVPFRLLHHLRELASATQVHMNELPPKTLKVDQYPSRQIFSSLSLVVPDSEWIACMPPVTGQGYTNMTDVRSVYEIAELLYPRDHTKRLDIIKKLGLHVEAYVNNTMKSDFRNSLLQHKTSNFAVVMNKKRRFWLPEYMTRFYNTSVVAQYCYQHCCVDDVIDRSGDLVVPPGLSFCVNDLQGPLKEIMNNLFRRVSALQLSAEWQNNGPTGDRGTRQLPEQMHWTQVAFFLVLLSGEGPRVVRRWPDFNESFRKWANDFRKVRAVSSQVYYVPSKEETTVKAAKLSDRDTLLFAKPVANGDVKFEVVNLDEGTIQNPVGEWLFPYNLFSIKITPNRNQAEDIGYLKSVLKHVLEYGRYYRALQKLRGHVCFPFTWHWSAMMRGPGRQPALEGAFPSPHDSKSVEDTLKSIDRYFRMGQLEGSCVLYQDQSFIPSLHPSVKHQWTFVEELVHLWPWMARIQRRPGL
jgi:hypothetical protein